MLAALRAGEISGEDAGDVLAALLSRLHAVPARVSDDPADRVLHLDLHPDNVMLTPEGPMVIDWCNTGEGPPGLDWAMSAVILAQVAVGPTHDAEVARAVLAALLASERCPLASDERSLADVLARRAADRAMTPDETRLLDDAATLIRGTLG